MAEAEVVDGKPPEDEQKTCCEEFTDPEVNAGSLRAVNENWIVCCLRNFLLCHLFNMFELGELDERMEGDKLLLLYRAMIPMVKGKASDEPFMGVDEEFTNAMMWCRQDLGDYRIVWTGDWLQDHKYWNTFNHPLLSVFLANHLDPVDRSERLHILWQQVSVSTAISLFLVVHSVRWPNETFRYYCFNLLSIIISVVYVVGFRFVAGCQCYQDGDPELRDRMEDIGAVVLSAATWISVGMWVFMILYILGGYELTASEGGTFIYVAIVNIFVTWGVGLGVQFINFWIFREIELYAHEEARLTLYTDETKPGYLTWPCQKIDLPENANCCQWRVNLLRWVGRKVAPIAVKAWGPFDITYEHTWHWRHREHVKWQWTRPKEIENGSCGGLWAWLKWQFVDDKNDYTFDFDAAWEESIKCITDAEVVDPRASARHSKLFEEVKARESASRSREQGVKIDDVAILDGSESASKGAPVETEQVNLLEQAAAEASPTAEGSADMLRQRKVSQEKAAKEFNLGF